MKNILCLILIFGFALSMTELHAQEDQAALLAKVEAMAKVGASYSPSFSPDGREIAFISDMSGLPQVWKISSDGGWPSQLTNFNDPVSGVTWSPDGKLIAFQLAPGGGMNSQVYIMNSDGSGVASITAGGKTNNWVGLWSEDGRYLSFSSNQENPSGMNSYLYDFQDQKAQLIAKNTGIGVISSMKEDQYLVNRLASRGSNDVYLVNKDNSETLLTQHSGPGEFAGKFSANGDIYMASNLDRDKVAFGKVEGDSIRILDARDDAELDDFVIDHAGQQALLVWNVGGKNEVSLYDLEGEKRARSLKLPVELFGGAEFSTDDRYLVFTGSGATEPANIWRYDLQLNTFKKLTDSQHPGIRLEELVTPSLFTFKSFDDLEMSGWLYLPKSGSAPYPMVISYHGGPEGQSRPSFSYTFQALLSQGIAVFAPNVRGSSGFGKRFVNLDNGALRVNGVKDIEACFDFVVNAGYAAKDKVGIMGGSYGGYMTMAGVTQYPDMFAAAANLYGVVNFKTFFEQTEPWMAAISKVEYGDPDTQAEMLEDLSPIHKVDLVKTPTLVLHGANDTNVPVVEAEQVVDNLKKRNIPVEYVLFPDEGHGWRKTANKVTSTVAIVEWFDRYLK